MQGLLAQFSDDRDGNSRVAQYLWGNNHWVRVQWLRGLVCFLADEGLQSQEALKAWAERSDYEKDFKGRVKFLGPAAYRWLLMRLGVDTVKPDVHLRRFVERVVGHSVGDDELVRVVSEAPRRLVGRPANWTRPSGSPSGGKPGRCNFLGRMPCCARTPVLRGLV